MIELKGLHNTALVFAKGLDEKSERQIKTWLDHPLFADTKVRLMPDVHVGVGVTIGFTVTMNEYVVPHVVGVDIGCGVNAYKLSKGSMDFDKLDKYIRKTIPAGKGVNKELHPLAEKAFRYLKANIGFDEFIEQVKGTAERVELPVDRVLESIGSLGGGNHFIEVDTDETGCRWLLIHSGSRCFGNGIALFHTDKAIKQTHEDSPIKFLSGKSKEAYIEDMKLAQLYARLNRVLMGFQIACDFFKVAHDEFESVESIHNYIDFEDGIVRKGAISARKGEKLVIPFSMADGAVIGYGKGNEEWNSSAPHGAGRKLSRTQAKGLSLDEFQKRMSHVWSSCVSKDTLDESPMAYKRTADILDYLEDTVDVTERLTPVYNFKA